MLVSPVQEIQGLRLPIQQRLGEVFIRELLSSCPATQTKQVRPGTSENPGILGHFDFEVKEQTKLFTHGRPKVQLQKSKGPTDKT